MDSSNDELLFSALELIKILFHFQPPSAELKNFVVKAEGKPLNEITVSLMLYYIASIISSEKTKEFLLPYWPISYKTRPQFRVGVKRFFTWIKGEWLDSNLGFSQSLLQNSHDTKFLPFLVKVACFTTKLLARRKNLDVDFPQNTDSLQQAKNELFSRMSSFTEMRKQLNAEYRRTLKLGRTLDRENLILKDLLVKKDALLKDLIKSCPSKYHERLMSDDWKTVVGDLEDYQNLREKNEEKLKAIESIASLASLLSELKTTHDSGCTVLDAKELVDVQKNLNSNETDNQVPFDEVIKLCYEYYHRIAVFLENTSPGQLLDSDEDTAEILSMKDSLLNSFRDCHEKMIKFSSLVRTKNDRLDVLLKERNPESRPRKLSNIFVSPVFTLPEEVEFDETTFSSPGMTGDQILEEIKNSIRLKQNITNDQSEPVSKKCSKIPTKVISVPSFQDQQIFLQSCSNSTNDHPSTPVSRKGSKIPRIIFSEPQEPAITLPPHWSSIAHGSHTKSGSNTSPLAISLLQKQAKEFYQKAEVFSSTVCSNISPKEVPVENLIETHLSPIFDNQIPSNVSKFIASSESSEFSDFDGNLLSNTEPKSPLIQSSVRSGLSTTNRRKSSPSLKAIIAKYKNLKKNLEELDDD